jgi:hypothetical protein
MRPCSEQFDVSGISIARHMCCDSSLGVSHLPMGHDGYCYFKLNPTAFQNFSLDSRCDKRMCFRGDTSGPDVWLKIENGRYVPAPPMVFVPGLQRIQDRLYHKEHPTGTRPTSDNNVARLPSSAIPPLPVPVPLPNPAVTVPHTASLTQPITKTSTPNPDSSTLNEEVVDVAASTLDHYSAAAAVVPEVSCPKPAEKAAKALVNEPVESHGKEPANVHGNAESDEESDPSVIPSQSSPASPESTASLISSATPPCQSDSCSSSLHSILKKSSTSTLEKTKSETGAGSRGKVLLKDEEMACKPKIRKSVSFAQDMVMPIPAPALPLRTKGRPISAADEGSAIAKRLVEWMASSQKGTNINKHLHRTRDTPDLGWIDHAHDNSAAGGGKRKKITRKLGVAAGAPSGLARTDRARSEAVGKARMAQSMVPNYDYSSYVDDEIPRRWS